QTSISVFIPPHPPTHHLHSFPTRRSSDLLTVTRIQILPRALIHAYVFTSATRQSSQLIIPIVTRPTWKRSSTALMCCPLCSQDRDRKSTRLNSSHGSISYAVFCLKKKTKQ